MISPIFAEAAIVLDVSSGVFGSIERGSAIFQRLKRKTADPYIRGRPPAIGARRASASETRRSRVDQAARCSSFEMISRILFTTSIAC